MTAADRPSVTDNARAEEQSGYTVQQTAAHFARCIQRVIDRIRSTDYQRSVSDIVVLDNVEGFLDRIARDDLDMFAAGRAETTTATDEEAVEAVARVLYESGTGFKLTKGKPWEELTDSSRDSQRRLAQALAGAGLLATARTRPTREHALKKAYRDRQQPIQEDDAWAFGEGVRAGVDAVLALLNEEAGR